MWIQNLVDASKAVEEFIGETHAFDFTIEHVIPAYDGIVFELSDHRKLKWWYGDEVVSILPDWKGGDNYDED